MSPSARRQKKKYTNCSTPSVKPGRNKSLPVEDHRFTAGEWTHVMAGIHHHNFSKLLGGLMKRPLVFALVFLLGASLSFAQESVSSQIKEVTLFSNQALIKREVTANLHEGLNEILIELQAFRVDRDSVSAKVFGEGEIYSVQFKEVFLKESPHGRIKALEQKIRELKRSKRILVDEKVVLGNREKFLSSIIDFSKTQVPRDIKTSFPKIEDLEKTLTFLSNNFQTINNKKQSLDAQIEEIEKEIRVLERELATLKRPFQKSKKVVEIMFHSKKEQTAKIEASYLVLNAYWHPFYKVDVPLHLEDVNLTMFSRINQKTGEDWNKISLSVSNVIPLKGVGLPSPRSWILDVARARQKVSKLSPRQPAAASLKEKMDVAADKNEAKFVQAQRKELPLSFEYKMPQALNIESKDKETLLPIFSKTLKGEFVYFSVPKTSPLTFLVCSTNADKELLSGALNVHFGGRFIGKTYLAEKKPGEAFKMSLGADREVKVKREKIKDKVKETYFGKIGRKTVVRDMAFKITVENLKAKPIKIKVFDSIPVSRTDRIEVKDLKIMPVPAEKNHQNREGVLLWEFMLKPGDKQEINMEFVVTYPKDAPIFGL
jgi:uncharacterized protein (TIGR02231 family)